MDPQIRSEASSHLTSFFQQLGQARQQNDPNLVSGLGGATEQLREFMSMPLDLTMLFANMSVELVEMILTSLEQAGFILVRGMTPA